MALHPFKALWHHVEQHHAEYGCALFVAPALVGAFVLIEVAYAVRWLVS